MTEPGDSEGTDEIFGHALCVVEREIISDGFALEAFIGIVRHVIRLGPLGDRGFNPDHAVLREGEDEPFGRVGGPGEAGDDPAVPRRGPRWS